MTLEDIETKIAELRKYEHEAREAKDYPAAIMFYGAGIHFERFLKEMREKG